MKKYDILKIINDGIEWLLLWAICILISQIPIACVLIPLEVIAVWANGHLLSLWLSVLATFLLGLTFGIITPTQLKAKYKLVVDKLKIFFEKYKI